MSTGRGNTARTRPQKYKNRTVFKNDLHDKTPKQKMLNNLHISEVCQHCKSVIEWKIKYKKYKPLSKPKTCVKCQERNIRKAYHVLCRNCALKDKVCAKCLKSSSEVEIILPEPSESEQQKLQSEMKRLIKTLPERKRRAFLRYMKKGKQSEHLEESEDEKENDEDTEEESKPKIKIPHSREDLLKKIEELQSGLDNDFNSDDDSENSYSDDDFYNDGDADDDDDDHNEVNENDSDNEDDTLNKKEKTTGIEK